MSKGRIILERRFVPKGSVIIREGEDAYSAFLVQSGSLSVYSRQADGKVLEFARLGVGEICGEMALVDEGLRAANVRAVEDCNLIVITRAAFEDKIKNSDPTIQAVVRMMIKRIKSANAELLDKKADTKSLIESAQLIYDGVKGDMDPKKAKEFERKVSSKLETFIKSVEHFTS